MFHFLLFMHASTETNLWASFIIYSPLFTFSAIHFIHTNPNTSVWGINPTKPRPPLEAMGWTVKITTSASKLLWFFYTL
jgi:hypothetical protein